MMLDAFLGTLGDTIAATTQFLLLLVLLVVGWFAYDRLTPYDFNEELVSRDNPAVGIALGGFLLASATALAGTVYGLGTTISIPTMSMLLLSGIEVLALLMLSHFVVDRLILRRFDVNELLVERRSLGTGFVLAGALVGTGLVLNGALSGESDSVLMGLRDIAVYWLVGQTLFVFMGFVFQWVTPYDVHVEIHERDNVAVGISFGGFLVASGFLVRAALLNASSRLTEELSSVLAVLLVGIPLLIASRAIADRVFMPSSPMSSEVGEQRNTAAASIAAASAVAVALFLLYVVTQCALVQTGNG
ncbi:MAG: DUF350 domain-containing protein [Lentisphaeria bacterium]|nr:DUF350 domain-containing protein [Lentisphaeria bacterium]